MTLGSYSDVMLLDVEMEVARNSDVMMLDVEIAVGRYW
jgi:hypothetical protein